MVELIITNRLNRRMIKYKSLPQLISMRPLTKKEIVLARKSGIRRFYLPSLSKTESAEFFNEFDKFWDQVVKPFGPDHAFWRNVVSSKMQDWERSAAYLALILFTLAKKTAKESPFIAIVCSSLEEEDVCEKWGKKMGWKVYRRPYLSLPYWSRRIFQEIRNLKNFLYMFSICFHRKCFSQKYKPKIPLMNSKILIASLLYNSCFKNGKYVDPFFGILHNIIKQNGNSVTYLCYPLSNFRESARKASECTEVSILLPYSAISWSELILLILKVFIRRIRLPRTNFLECDFSSLIEWNAHRFDFFYNFHSEIYYAAVNKLCKNEHFDRLIQLYEGNCFERGCIQAFRKYSSGLIVGYSHAVVFPLNLKIRLTENEKAQKPEPDVFVSTGPETKRLMEKIGKRESSRIYSACSLRNIPVLDVTKTARRAQSDILVAFDGVWGCVTVLDWLIEQTEILKEYKVRLRGHPNVPIKTLLDHCLYDIPDNFYLSYGDLKVDIESSFCVIYRQTSVGIQSLMNGVPVIHLDIDAPLPCDPIMNLKASKWTVRTPEELLAALQEIYSLKEERKIKLINIAKKYAKDYFAAPDDKNIRKFFM